MLCSFFLLMLTSVLYPSAVPIHPSPAELEASVYSDMEVEVDHSVSKIKEVHFQDGRKVNHHSLLKSTCWFSQM